MCVRVHVSLRVRWEGRDSDDPDQLLHVTKPNYRRDAQCMCVCV